MKYCARVQEVVEGRTGVGALDPCDPLVLTGLAAMRSLSHAVRLQARLDASGLICECVYKACGCPATLACAAQAVSHLRGKPWPELRSLRPETLLTGLGLMPIHHRNAALVCRAALNAATRATREAMP